MNKDIRSATGLEYQCKKSRTECNCAVSVAWVQREGRDELHAIARTSGRVRLLWIYVIL